MTKHTTQLESILFFKGEPVSAKELSGILGVSEQEVTEVAEQLKRELEEGERGLRLAEHKNSYMFVTAPEMSDKIEKLLKEELEKDLGKAGLETLTIVLYYGPITRAKVDYIRGVNSSFILRQLSIRGLVERKENPKDQRSYLYSPTFELLSFLGITSVKELPEYEEVQKEINQFEQQQEDEQRGE